MGVKEYEVFGRIRFGKEEQFTHLCLIIEAYSSDDAKEKAEKICLRPRGRSGFSFLVSLRPHSEAS